MDTQALAFDIGSTVLNGHGGRVVDVPRRNFDGPRRRVLARS